MLMLPGTSIADIAQNDYRTGANISRILVLRTHVCGRLKLIVNSEQTYRTFPPLQKPENNVLLLLTWSSMADGPHLRVFTEWASSKDGLNLYLAVSSLGIAGFPKT
jgi:hypothetical protein